MFKFVKENDLELQTISSRAQLEAFWSFEK